MAPGMWEYTPAVYLHRYACPSAMRVTMYLSAGCMVRQRMSFK